jgi:hypothetical protein
MRSLGEKKQDFLRKKANEIYAPLDHTNELIDDLYAQVSGPGVQIPGFITTKLENRFTYRKDYQFYSVKNAAGNGLNLEFYTRMIRGLLPEKRLALNFDIFNIQWGWHIYKTGFIHLFLDRLETIETEYLEYAAKAEKEERILQITRNSIVTWIDAILKDGGRAYHIEKEDDRITLKVELKNRRTLELPVYYSSFQETIPGLIRAIRDHEGEEQWE